MPASDRTVSEFVTQGAAGARGPTATVRPMHSLRRPTRRTRGGAGVAFALALIASACGGASTTDTVEAADPTSVASVPTTAPLDEPGADAPLDESTADTAAATTVPTNPVPTTAVPAASTPEPTVAAPTAAAVQLPSIDVVDLATGQTADLATFAKPGPTLVWFWAPH